MMLDGGGPHSYLDYYGTVSGAVSTIRFKNGEEDHGMAPQTKWPKISLVASWVGRLTARLRQALINPHNVKL